jgi:hypothetical protein
MDALWQIEAITAANEVITGAKYRVTAQDGEHTVSTEGFWTFAGQQKSIPFADVTEQNIVDWIKGEAVRDGRSLIEGRLQEQIDALKAESVVIPPWKPQIFTPNL